VTHGSRVRVRKFGVRGIRLGVWGLEFGDWAWALGIYVAGFNAAFAVWESLGRAATYSKDCRLLTAQREGAKVGKQRGRIGSAMMMSASDGMPILRGSLSSNPDSQIRVPNSESRNPVTRNQQNSLAQYISTSTRTPPPSSPWKTKQDLGRVEDSNEL
jgi:hypothetical protein